MAVDAGLVEADGSKKKSTAKQEWIASVIDPTYAPRPVRVS